MFQGHGVDFRKFQQRFEVGRKRQTFDPFQNFCGLIFLVRNHEKHIHHGKVPGPCAVRLDGRDDFFGLFLVTLPEICKIQKRGQILLEFRISDAFEHIHHGAVVLRQKLAFGLLDEALVIFVATRLYQHKPLRFVVEAESGLIPVQKISGRSCGVVDFGYIGNFGKIKLGGVVVIARKAHNEVEIHVVVRR